MRRSSLDQGEGLLAGHYVNTAYDKIVIVASNMDDINLIAATISTGDLLADITAQVVLSDTYRDSSEAFAVKPYNTPLTVLEGGNNSDIYSSLHWASVALIHADNASTSATSAENWATTGVDTLVPGEAEYSAKHYSIKSADQLSIVTNAGNAQVQLAVAQVDFSEEWATKPKNITVSAGAGGGVGKYSALHYAEMAEELSEFYLGVSATNPTERIDTSALQVGDLYFNSANNDMRVWSTNNTWDLLHEGFDDLYLGAYPGALPTEDHDGNPLVDGMIAYSGSNGYVVLRANDTWVSLVTAATSSAGSVNVIDSEEMFAADNVEDVITEIGNKITVVSETATNLLGGTKLVFKDKSILSTDGRPGDEFTHTDVLAYEAIPGSDLCILEGYLLLDAKNEYNDITALFISITDINDPSHKMVSTAYRYKTVYPFDFYGTQIYLNSKNLTATTFPVGSTVEITSNPTAEVLINNLQRRVSKITARDISVGTNSALAVPMEYFTTISNDINYGGNQVYLDIAPSAEMLAVDPTYWTITVGDGDFSVSHKVTDYNVAANRVSIDLNYPFNHTFLIGSQVSIVVWDNIDLKADLIIDDVAAITTVANDASNKVNKLAGAQLPGEGAVNIGLEDADGNFKSNEPPYQTITDITITSQGGIGGIDNSLIELGDIMVLINPITGQIFRGTVSGTPSTYVNFTPAVAVGEFDAVEFGVVEFYKPGTFYIIDVENALAHVSNAKGILFNDTNYSYNVTPPVPTATTTVTVVSGAAVSLADSSSATCAVGDWIKIVDGNGILPDWISTVASTPAGAENNPKVLTTNWSGIGLTTPGDTMAVGSIVTIYDTEPDLPNVVNTVEKALEELGAPKAFRAHVTGGTTNLGTYISTGRPIPFDTLQYRTDTLSFNTGTGVYMPNKAGIYRISAQIKGGSGLRIQKNDDLYDASNRYLFYYSGTGGLTYGSVCLELNGSTDNVRVFATSTSGVDISVNGIFPSDTYFEAIRIA